MAIIKHYCKHTGAWFIMWPWFVLNQLIFSGRGARKPGQCSVCGARADRPPKLLARLLSTIVLQGRQVTAKETTEKYLQHLTCWKCGSYISEKGAVIKNNH